MPAGTYFSHLTVGVAKFDDLKMIEAEPFEPSTVQAAGVAVYHLGNNGTARATQGMVAELSRLASTVPSASHNDEMAPRGSRPHQIGATQVLEFASEDLESVQLAGLDARFELEDVQVCSVSLLNVDAGSGRIGRAHLKDVDLGESKLRAVDFVDVIAERIDAANGDWGGAQLRRTLFSDARLTGLSFAEARIAEVSFKACKLDYANFRHSKIERVSFEDCVLTGADFQGASINATVFSRCQLVEADFSKAAMSLVDLRGSELRLAGSVLGFRGAIIDPLQLMELSRTLAQELGITVEDA